MPQEIAAIVAESVREYVSSSHEAKARMTEMENRQDRRLLESKKVDPSRAFIVGDSVLLYDEKISGGFQKKWTGPFQIVGQLGWNTFLIEGPNGILPRGVNARRLLRYLPKSSPFELWLEKSPSALAANSSPLAPDVPLSASPPRSEAATGVKIDLPAIGTEDFDDDAAELLERGGEGAQRQLVAPAAPVVPAAVPYNHGSVIRNYIATLPANNLLEAKLLLAAKYVRQIKPETGKALPKFQQDVEDVANTMNSKHNEFRDVVTRALRPNETIQEREQEIVDWARQNYDAF